MKEKNKKIKLILGVIVGLQLLVVGLVFHKFKVGGQSGGEGSSSDGAFPIWMAAMIPVIVASRKRKGGKTDERKFYVILLALGVLVLAGIVVMYINIK